MKYIKYFIALLFVNFSVFGFNIIPLDKVLIEHQEAFKDFEQYLSNCKVEVFNEGNTTVYDYEFASIEAKKSFYNYREKNKNLIAKISQNLFLKGLILGLLTTWHDRFFKEQLFNQKTLVLNLVASIALLLHDKLSKPKEPYIGLGSLNKYDNLFALNDMANLIEIPVILAFSLAGRLTGELIYL